MIIIGVDFHPEFQQIAFVDTDTGELDERRLHQILRFLLVEAAQVTVRSLPEWRSRYFHLMMRRGRKIAKVAMARRLAVCLYWMLRQGRDYQQYIEFGSHAGQPGHRHGVQ
jgi:transposase